MNFENTEVITQESIKEMNVKELLRLSIDFIDMISNEIDENNEDAHHLLDIQFDIINEVNKKLGYIK